MSSLRSTRSQTNSFPKNSMNFPESFVEFSFVIHQHPSEVIAPIKELDPCNDALFITQVSPFFDQL